VLFQPRRELLLLPERRVTATAATLDAFCLRDLLQEEVPIPRLLFRAGFETQTKPQCPEAPSALIQLISGRGLLLLILY